MYLYGQRLAQELEGSSSSLEITNFLTYSSGRGTKDRESLFTIKLIYQFIWFYLVHIPSKGPSMKYVTLQRGKGSEKVWQFVTGGGSRKSSQIAWHTLWSAPNWCRNNNMGWEPAPSSNVWNQFDHMYKTLTIFPSCSSRLSGRSITSWIGHRPRKR